MYYQLSCLEVLLIWISNPLALRPNSPQFPYILTGYKISRTAQYYRQGQLYEFLQQAAKTNSKR